jgi:MFS family permease
MYGGYLPFMFGVLWLGVWSLLAGFARTPILLDVARAMQGLAIAAYIPSTFAMIGCIYPEGPRKNLVLGLYSGCAPLGFFAGFLAAGALPSSATGWYFWIAAGLCGITAVTAYLTVPHDRTDRQMLGLRMDWIGAGLITGGLILVAYALGVQPYANQFYPGRSGWTFPMVLGPLISGVACLGVAFWVEGWIAQCPLLPFDFFSPKSVKAFSLACLCFYASYGVWLYESAQFLQSSTASGTEGGIQGLLLAAWYTPTAVGGLLLCVVGGALLHVIPIMMLLLISALAWIGAPLLLALCPLPMNYWAFVMPSMLCATIGIDITFTISVVFLSSVSPLRYQGLAGAVSSILVNLAMSFALSISEIAAVKAESTIHVPEGTGPEVLAAEEQREIWGARAAFFYAAASAGLGLIIAVLFVRISRTVVQAKRPMLDEEDGRASSEVSTLVDVPRP